MGEKLKKSFNNLRKLAPVLGVVGTLAGAPDADAQDIPSFTTQEEQSGEDQEAIEQKPLRYPHEDHAREVVADVIKKLKTPIEVTTDIHFKVRESIVPAYVMNPVDEFLFWQKVATHSLSTPKGLIPLEQIIKEPGFRFEMKRKRNGQDETFICEYSMTYGRIVCAPDIGEVPENESFDFIFERMKGSGK